MGQATGSADGSGIATAVLVYGAGGPDPDLAPILQFLLDDLTAAGLRVTGLWMGAGAAHLVFDGHDLILAQRGQPPAGRWQGLMRPQAGPGAIRPDLLRARLARALQAGAHRLTLTLRLGGPDGSAPHDGQTAEIAHLCLMPVIEATAPLAVLWLPGRLVLAPDELASGGPGLLRRDGDPETRLHAAPAAGRQRPGGTVRPAHPRLIRPRPQTRAQRAARASAGRLFGPPGLRIATPLPRPDRAIARLHAALRSDDPFDLPAPRPARALRAYAVAAQWIVLLPQLLASLLPYA